MDIEMYKNASVESFTPEQIDLLDAPLDAQLIKERPDKKKYLKGSTEFEAANRIFGYGKWGYRVIARTLQKVYDLDDKVVGLYFYVEVELFVAGAMFPFYGDGGQSVKYYTPQGYEDASKGATTDAVKRALRHYGNAFGLPLYDEDSLVDIGDGALARVGDVKVTPHGRQPQKQIVASQNAPKQIAQPTPQDEVATRLNTLYKRALALKLIERGTDGGAFLKYIGGIIGANITVPGELTKSRLDTVEQFLNAKDVA
jgi:hypothetical protein